MIQEIITYIIIITAFAWAGYKIFKKFRRKKIKTKTPLNVSSGLSLHKCDDCSAECMLRDTIKPIRLNEPEFCKKIEIQ